MKRKGLKRVKMEMIMQAMSRVGIPRPAGSKKTFDRCFVVAPEEIQFWYNDTSDNTYVIIRKVAN